MTDLNKKKFGFTLIEIIIAITIGLTMIMIMAVFSAEGLKQIYLIRSQEQLNETALSITNVFTYWIKQGKDLQTPSPSPSDLHVVLRDVPEKVFSKSGDFITLDGVAITSNNLRVTQLIFTPMDLVAGIPQSVRIEFTLQTISSSAPPLNIKTTIARRN